MQRYTSKHFRRLGLRKSDSPKDPSVRRNYPPGMHGPKGFRRQTEYGIQLAEKQKAKVLYNLAEKQFRNYYEKAFNMSGDTGLQLQQLLEMRLDNVIYRLGFANSRPQARQLVSHGFIAVNGKKVDIPSYQVKVKDQITINPHKNERKYVVERAKVLEKHTVPGWLSLDSKAMLAKVSDMPRSEDAEQAINPRLIVEFYSR